MNQARTAAAPDLERAQPLTADELRLIDAYWRAANYLSVGQIYLIDNPLLKRPLRLEDIKPRLLGHWGTTPGLNFIHAHANRVIKKRDLDAIYIMGPGHGGPAGVANAYLEGTYTERYPNVSRDESGIRNLFRQFSFPGGIPSHNAPETPGSIHEGGELGYALVHAYGAAFEQVPPPSARWSRAADPSPQRLQDRQPNSARPHPGERAARADAWLRPRAGGSERRR